MMKLYFLISFSVLTVSYSCYSQDNNKTENYASVITEFSANANDNFLFGNGLSRQIEKPKNEIDALKKGFGTISFDEGKPTIEETEILDSQTVNINSVEYSAVLFSYKNVNRIALYRPKTNGMYYFRVYEL